MTELTETSAPTVFLVLIHPRNKTSEFLRSWAHGMFNVNSVHPCPDSYLSPFLMFLFLFSFSSLMPWEEVRRFSRHYIRKEALSFVLGMQVCFKAHLLSFDGRVSVSPSRHILSLPPLVLCLWGKSTQLGPSCPSCVGCLSGHLRTGEQGTAGFYAPGSPPMAYLPGIVHDS